MRLTAYIIFFVSLTLYGFSQRFVEPDKMKSFNITVNYPDYTVKTQMLKDPKKMTPDVDLTYHWYMSQKIMETKGGFDGKLLHGYYHSFYLNDQLFESGEFNYGVKSGEWKNWYADGKLKEVTNWKNGRKNGNYALYNNYGVLMATGKFKKDLLTGEFKTYDTNGKVSSVRHYKDGIEIIPKEKVLKGINPKRKSDDSSRPSTDGTNPQTDKKSFGQKMKSLFKKKSEKSEKAKTSEKTAITT